MRVAIVGAGAMGTLLGHGFCRAGNQVAVLDVPNRVKQLRKMGGLEVISADGDVSSATPSIITSDFRAAGKQEVVVLACKAQDLPTAVKDIEALVDDDTAVITIQNGIPWWYLYGLPEPYGGSRIRCLDPDGVLEKKISSEQIVGCVAYPAAALESDGRARHVEGDRYPIGELDGSERERTRRILELFQEAGLRSRIIDDIRSEIWLKAWGALSINPISALTRATMEDICTFAATRELVAEMMKEAQKVAETLGAHFRHTIERRIEGARAVGAHKTSMLQDVEAGHVLELDALMLAVIELAEMTDQSVPTIRTVYACTALLNDNLTKSYHRGE